MKTLAISLIIGAIAPPTTVIRVDLSKPQSDSEIRAIYLCGNLAGVMGASHSYAKNEYIVKIEAIRSRLNCEALETRYLLGYGLTIKGSAGDSSGDAGEVAKEPKA